MKNQEEYFLFLTKTREIYLQKKSIKERLDLLISEYSYCHKVAKGAKDEKNI